MHPQTDHTPPGAPTGTLPAPSQQGGQEAPRVTLDPAEFLTPERSAILDRLDEKHAAAHAAQGSLLPADHLPGLELTPLGARVTGAVDQAAVLTRLRMYRGFGASWRWLMGDLVCSLAVEHDGDLAYAWQLVADEDLDSRSSLSRSVAVARMVPLERRRAGLSWSHHEAVLAADPRRQHSTPIEEGDDRDLLLGRAEAEGWTVDKLETHIAGMHAEPQDELPNMPARPPWETPAFNTTLRRGLAAGHSVLACPDGTVLELPPGFDVDRAKTIIDTIGREG